MKGVIVQIGDPKSIVLYNTGKIGAIPTPSNCHVGMEVSVKYNNKLKFIALSLAAVLLVGLGVFIGTAVQKDQNVVLLPSETHQTMPTPQYESGPGRMMGHGMQARMYQSVSVNQAKNLPDDTLVLLSGNIVESLGDEKYTFRDSTGDISIEIDRKLWRSLSVGATDTVEISGEMDIERGQVKIDVKNIKKE